MVALLHESIEAGALGFSTTLSSTHSDGDGKPVASRWARTDELLALCKAVGEHEGTLLEGIVPGCLDKFSDDEIELLVEMSAAAGRPLNWNVLTIDAPYPGAGRRASSKASTRAREAGGRVVALTMPILVPMNMSLRTFCALNLIPGWGEILGLPVPERIAKLRDPEVRAEMLRGANSPEAGVFRRLADFGRYVIGDTYSAANEGLKGRGRRTSPPSAAQDAVRHAGRDLRRRRAAHGAVADADRQRPGLLGAARRDLGQRGRHARRLRRRRPPRPDVRGARTPPASSATASAAASWSRWSRRYR